VAGAGRTEKFHQPHVNVQKSLDLIGLEIFPSFASTRRQPRQWSGLDFFVQLCWSRTLSGCIKTKEQDKLQIME
jgi:hypothetical protein